MTINADEVAQARAIVRELMAPAPALLGAHTLDSEAPFAEALPAEQ